MWSFVFTLVWLLGLWKPENHVGNFWLELEVACSPGPCFLTAPVTRNLLISGTVQSALEYSWHQVLHRLPFEEATYAVACFPEAAFRCSQQRVVGADSTLTYQEQPEQLTPVAIRVRLCAAPSFAALCNLVSAITASWLLGLICLYRLLSY